MNDTKHSAGNPPEDAQTAGNGQALGESVGADGEALRSEEALRGELDQLRDKLLRAQADFDNYQKRVLRERAEERRYAFLPLLRDLLPVRDNLQRALDAAEKSDGPSALLEGVRLVAQQLGTVFEQYGCREIAAQGADFDPHLHDALTTQPSDEPAGACSRCSGRGINCTSAWCGPRRSSSPSDRPALNRQADSSACDEAPFQPTTDKLTRDKGQRTTVPTYDYRCDGCEHEFEHFQSIKDDPLKDCPECGKPKLRRLFGTGAAIVFKGSGFYQTDYRSESYKKRAAEDKPAADKPAADKPASDSSSKSDGSSSKKTEAKPDSAAAKTKPSGKPKAE